MLIRTIIIAAACLCCVHASAEDAALKKTLLAQQTKLLEALKSQDRAAVEEMLLDQHFAVDDKGRQTEAQTIARLDKIKVTSYSVSGVKLVPLSEDVGLLTYEYTWSGTENGTKVTGRKSYDTSVWAKRDGQWRSVFYQSTPIGK